MSTKILKDGTVLAFNEVNLSLKILRKASVLIVNDRITAIEENSDDLPDTQNAETINFEGKIVSPGFVNTHLHAWQTAYRSIAPNVTLVQYFDWLSAKSHTSTMAFSPENIYISSLEGYLEGLNGGVTSFVEHAHNNCSRGVMESGFDAAVDSGARIWWCYDLSTTEGFSELEQWDALGKIADKPRPGSVAMGLSYDGLLDASDDRFERVKENIL